MGHPHSEAVISRILYGLSHSTCGISHSVISYFSSTGISRSQIDAWKETGKPYPSRRRRSADRYSLVRWNICQRLARHIATRKGCFSLAMEQETRCHEPSAFYSNVEYSNDPRDGIIGSNDRDWNPLATPSMSGQCVCLHPKEFIYGTIDGLIRRGKAQSMSLWRC